MIIAILMALYLFGFIRFPHDSKNQKRSITATVLGAGMVALAVYLVTGFGFSERTQTYNALPMLSGLAPPAHYNFFKPVPEPDATLKAKYAS